MIDEKGQALIEYLFVFGFMAYITLMLFKGVTGAMNAQLGNLSSALTQKLSTGVCEKNCFFNNFGN